MYQETAGSGDGQMYQESGTGRMYQDTNQVSGDSLGLSIERHPFREHSIIT